MNQQNHHTTPPDKKYETCSECWASFGITSETVEPSKINEILGITPSSQKTKGEMFINHLNQKKMRPINSWHIESNKIVDSKDLRDHIDYVLDFLIPVKEKVIEVQKISDLKMRLTCSWWGAMHSGPVLWPEQLQKIAMLNIELVFFFASYDDEK